MFILTEEEQALLNLDARFTVKSFMENIKEDPEKLVGMVKDRLLRAIQSGYEIARREEEESKWEYMDSSTHITNIDELSKQGWNIMAIADPNARIIWKKRKRPREPNAI